MPIYEYSCPKCGEFEITQRITDGPLKKCPTCKSKVHKLISNTSFQLKGSGWYVTDYRDKKGSGKDASKDAGGAKDSGTSAGSDTSSKGAGSESKKSKESSTTSKKDPSAKAA